MNARRCNIPISNNFIMEIITISDVSNSMKRFATCYLAFDMPRVHIYLQLITPLLVFLLTSLRVVPSYGECLNSR